MYLVELADIIMEAINISPPENWNGGLVPAEDLPVVSGFDPFTAQSEIDPGIYIVPGYNEYNLSNSRRSSSGRVGASSIKRLSIVVCTPFGALLDVANTHKDVSHPSEWALLSNLREDLESFLINLHIDGAKLVDVEPEPPDELALDNRIYLASTSLGYSPC